ncbi:MAG TPA: Clp protease N-terminal domain-containing protein [Streptosporangiaceae bacterium]|nr:Clp protease N-terminal domain-containing protein [Streptosporangiaceae bacterium]
MATLPVSLDNLISYVKTLHPSAGPLENLSAAVGVAADLDEQSDALIGHFVDQARRSGASWSQIGASMGVSKQAVQKRFVAQWDSAEFSRFTQRTRNVLTAADRIAKAAGADYVGEDHLTAGLLSEPDALAARVMHAAGLTDEQVLGALGLEAPVPPAPAAPAAPAVGRVDADGYAAALRKLRFTGAGRAALRGALHAALGLGHNYIGTEHLLLGILRADGDAGQRLTGLGLTAQRADRLVADEFSRIQAERRPSA